MNKLKQEVFNFWNEASCGEALYLRDWSKDAYLEHAEKRYEIEPWIKPFAEFERYKDKKVLEIGVGLGAEHYCFAVEGADLNGIDLTERAIEHTRRRLDLFGLSSDLKVADAEALPYEDDTFDLVYAWGVLHHSPDTPKAVSEVYRVLKKGGEAKIMIYHKYSLVGYMLWIRYALLRFKPFTSLSEIYYQHLESPGTKAYSVSEARAMLNQFESVHIETILGHGDLLTAEVGQRHQGISLKLLKRFWPRWFLKRVFKKHGLAMLIKVKK